MKKAELTGLLAIFPRFGEEGDSIIYIDVEGKDSLTHTGQLIIIK